MKINLLLPRVINEERLSEKIFVEADGKKSNYILTCDNVQIFLPLSNKENVSIYMDFSEVIYFEDSAILILLLIQNILIKNGVKITHFLDKLGDYNESFCNNYTINCNKYVLRQLNAIGYLKQWMKVDFSGSFEESDKISMINPLDGINPLDSQSDILSIIACESENELQRFSQDNVLISNYEKNASIEEFIFQGEKSFKERKIIDNGEFGQIIVRQCRKNIIEHAKPFYLAFSTARIVHSERINEDWNINCNNLRKDEKTEIFGIFENSSKKPILIMTTIDDGIGITNSIQETWNNNTLNVTNAYTRVKRITENWPINAELIEFALDKEGSSKLKEYRSLEDPGLSRIDEIIRRENGTLQVYSGDYLVVHNSDSKPCWLKKKRGINFGTMVKTVVPLEFLSRDLEQDLYDRRIYILPESSISREEKQQEDNLINLSAIWLAIKSENGKNQSIKKRIAKLIKTAEISFINNNDNCLLFLDWSELPWGEHETSLFLIGLREIIIDKCFVSPFVHINVPFELILLAKKAVEKYAEKPCLPSCVFFEGTNNIFWLGLTVRYDECVLTPKTPDRTSFNIFGNPENSDEQFLRIVFNELLEGKENGKINHYGYGIDGYTLAKKYLQNCYFFEEITKSNTYDRNESKTGRFLPVAKLDFIAKIISSTFISKLRKALDSPYCSFPDNSIKNDRKLKEYIQLPNGYLVDKYIRCDGLLHYNEKEINENKIDSFYGHHNFINEFIDHLLVLAKRLEQLSTNRYDIVVSCTSPTHWFVHKLADGLSDRIHNCSHFVAKSHSTFKHEFNRIKIRSNSKVLIFTDVISKGNVIRAMINSVKERNLICGGLLSIVDTRKKSTSGQNNDQSISNALSQYNQISFVHMPIEKRKEGRVRWKIDPETLEPFKIEKNERIDSYFKGIGALALPGDHSINWLINFGSIKHKHYKHGSHHSATVCDIKKLFKRTEVRTLVGGRLNLYLNTKKIDLIVYPNHSNAYMLIDMIHELGDKNDFPDTQIALCRYSHNERSYILPIKASNKKFKNILLIDDGFVTGKTIRSLITCILNTYGTTREIHIVVFVNEMTPPHTAYWTKIGESTDMEFEKKRRKGPFLYPKINFNAFISFPHSTYSTEDCPYCRKQRNFQRFSDDNNKTIYEREFYRSWSEDLEFKDLYHSTDDKILLKNKSQKEIDEYFYNRSKDTYEIVKFELMLHKNVKIDSLINEIKNQKNINNYLIHSIRALLHIKDTRLNNKQESALIEIICDHIKNHKTNRNHKILLLKAIIWEQLSPLSESLFFQILESCIEDLKDPKIFGAILALARIAFKPGQKVPSWTDESIKKEFDLLITKYQNFDNLSFVVNIYDLLTGRKVIGLGDAVVSIKNALLPKKGHSNIKDNISLLNEKLTEISQNIDLKNSHVNSVTSLSMRILETFDELEKCAKIILSSPAMKLKEKWYNVLEDTTVQLNYIRTLMDIESINNPILIKEYIYKSSFALKSLDTLWFSHTSGLTRQILKHYLNYVIEAIEEAINYGENEYRPKYDDQIINIDKSNFETKEGLSLEVLCPPMVINEAFRNIVSNFWKYVVPIVIKSNEIPFLKFSYKIDRQKVYIFCEDNGIYNKNINYFNKNEGGHFEIRPKIKEYHGSYKILPSEKNGTIIEIGLYCRRTEN